MFTYTHIEIIPADETVEPYEVEVEWRFSPFDPGVTSGPNEACYPAEGGEKEECELTLPDGSVVDDGESWLRKMVGDDEYHLAEEEAFEQARYKGD